MASAEANFPIQHIKAATTTKRFLCYTRQQQEPEKLCTLKNPNSQSEHSEQVAKSREAQKLLTSIERRIYVYKHITYSNVQIANGNEGKKTGIMCMMGEEAKR